MKNLSKVVLKPLKRKRNCPCVHNQNKQDTQQKTHSMTLGFAKGFTLIELLVVVLIIGILSAVALPQYRVAVAKSQAVEAMINAKALYDAAQIVYLETGEYPTDITTLPIQWKGTLRPGDGGVENGVITFPNGTFCSLDLEDNWIDCTRNGIRIAYNLKPVNSGVKAGRILCLAGDGKEIAQKVCKSMGATFNGNSNYGWDIYRIE